MFITGMGERLFPCEFHQNMLDDQNTICFTGYPPIYEERRLFYVGMTRAQNSLILTSAMTRQIFGSYQNRPVSPFIAEIPASLCEQITRKMPKRKKTNAKQMMLFKPENE